ncbi:hypothetical protein NDU88_002480 [Pleurodeles waltl]|uniref:Uncharacterized protein n=1 Tax=Pleurodeles waltl TaxID=8319 RepID=A0AAV7LFZ5_PLEWA|nr:hypothetical protein NDU88_002480 [Pleurodeles waltl]
MKRIMLGHRECPKREALHKIYDLFLGQGLKVLASSLACLFYSLDLGVRTSENNTEQGAQTNIKSAHSRTGAIAMKRR